MYLGRDPVPRGRKSLQNRPEDGGWPLWGQARNLTVAVRRARPVDPPIGFAWVGQAVPGETCVRGVEPAVAGKGDGQVLAVLVESGACRERRGPGFARFPARPRPRDHYEAT